MNIFLVLKQIMQKCYFRFLTTSDISLVQGQPIQLFNLSNQRDQILEIVSICMAHYALKIQNSSVLPLLSSFSTLETIKICFAIQNRGRKRIVRFVVSSRDTIVRREPSSVWLRAPASTRCKSHKSFIKAIETTRLRAVLPLTTERVSLIFRRASGPAGDIRGPQGIVAEIQRLKSLTTVRNDTGHESTFVQF